MSSLRQCQNYRRFMKKLGWIVESIGHQNVIYIKTIPFFPIIAVAKVQRSNQQINFQLIKGLSKKYRSLFVKIEPKLVSGEKEAKILHQTLKKNGYKIDSSSLMATKTSVLKISSSQSTLLSKMHSKTRYNIRLSKKRNVVIKLYTGDQIAKNQNLVDDFYQVLSANSKRLKIFTYPKKWFMHLVWSFQKDALVLFAFLDEKPIAVSLFLIADNTIYYSHNGSLKEGRTNMAPYLIIWQAILEAKKRKLKFLDFDGIHDDRYKQTLSWKGFTRFKLGFGGDTISYMPSYISWLPFLR